jgi:hypothetical protein
MDTQHLILETDSFLELQGYLDFHAKNGYRAISMSSYFDYGMGKAYYNALLVKEVDGEK